MSRDKDEFAGAGRLTRAIGLTLSAEVDPPPRLLGPLAGKPDPIFNQIFDQLPLATAPQQDSVERIIEIVEELGADEAMKALLRKAPGPTTGAMDDFYLDQYIKALEASGGSLNKARRKFDDLSGLSLDRSRKKFTEIHRVVKIISGHS
jgi:hypothetical protein